MYNKIFYLSLLFEKLGKTISLEEGLKDYEGEDKYNLSDPFVYADDIVIGFHTIRSRTN